MGDEKGIVTGVTGEKSENSPYLIFSADNPGALITSVQLKGENYSEWATEMMNALQAKRKTGFIDGTLKKPPEGHSHLESWLSVNSMIVGWLRTSIDPRVRSTVTFITNAHKLWENLKERFSVGNKVRVHQLMSKLASCRQDGEAVIDYYGRLAKM
uniref:Retrotransposon Copia-like N-terminal domain-containing protein n=1 Tax=Brassica campestris TaxID=3711 RepID=M4EME5_BRACM